MLAPEYRSVISILIRCFLGFGVDAQTGANTTRERLKKMSGKTPLAELLGPNSMDAIDARDDPGLLLLEAVAANDIPRAKAVLARHARITPAITNTARPLRKPPSDSTQRRPRQRCPPLYETS